MKKNLLLTFLLFVGTIVNAQIEPTAYRGAFAPAPAAMWTDTWTNFTPQTTDYATKTAGGNAITKTDVQVDGNIDSNTYWTKDKLYHLNTVIYITNNATLTIQPGTVIVGNKAAVGGSALVVTRGAKLIADGTKNEPIVFTSNQAAGSRATGDWGGVILLGKSTYNLNGGEGSIEGIIPSDYTKFGGLLAPVATDNSGILRYVRIEFGGYVFSPNNEINGLTMGAVGNGTVIDYVQTSFINDDSFEWFGGTVNCKHLVAFSNIDDDFDTDNGYSGTVQFGLALRDPSRADAPAVSTSEGFESDNNATGSTATPKTSAIFSNMTMIGASYRATLPGASALAVGYERAVRIRRNSELKIYNSVFTDYKKGLELNGSACIANLAANTLQFRNNILSGSGTGTNLTGITSTEFTDRGNSQVTSAGATTLMTAPYDVTDGTKYYGGSIDFRPLAAGPLESGSSFANSYINAALTKAAPVVTPTVLYCQGATASPLSATVSVNSGNTLLWYTVATGGVGSATAPTPSTATLGSTVYYVSQVYANATESLRSKITVTVSVPAMPTAITGSLPICSFIGTATPVTYTATLSTVIGTTYKWVLPTGATAASPAVLVSGTTYTTTSNAIVVSFAGVATGAATYPLSVQAVSPLGGCESAAKTITLTAALPVTPASLVLNDLASATPTTAITAVGPYVGTVKELKLTAGVVAGATYEWTLPAGARTTATTTAVAEETTGTFVTNTNVIYIDLAPEAGVGSLVISVKAKLGCGVSALARTLTLTKALPAVPALITPSSVNVCSVAGTSAIVSYSVAPVAGAFADGYSWTVPTGATIVTASPDGTLIDVTYSSSFTAGNVTVTASNGVGITAAKTLAVAKTAPAIPTITGQLTGITGNQNFRVNYFISSTNSTSKTITGPIGSILRSALQPSNTTNTLTTAESTFSVVFPTSYTTGTITATASNGCSTSAAKVITVTSATPVTYVAPTVIYGNNINEGGAATAATTYCTTVNSPKKVSVDAIANIPNGASFNGSVWSQGVYVWEVTGTNPGQIIAGQGTNAISINFYSPFGGAASTGTQTVSVKLVTPNNTTTVYSVDLNPGGCSTARMSAPEVVVSETQLYPNPTSDFFNLEIPANDLTSVDVTVYSYNGTIVNKKRHDLEKGNNTITTNVSSLANGIYFVKFENPTTKNVEVKRFIKK